MDLITERSELDQNIQRLHAYASGSGIDREFAIDLITRGICFVVAEVQGSTFFAPSRFVGYRGNSRDDHMHSLTKDGRVTNVAIAGVVHSQPLPSMSLEREYAAFCASLGVSPRTTPFARGRKFWDLR